MEKSCPALRGGGARIKWIPRYPGSGGLTSSGKMPVDMAKTEEVSALLRKAIEAQGVGSRQASMFTLNKHTVCPLSVQLFSGISLGSMIDNQLRTLQAPLEFFWKSLPQQDRLVLFVHNRFRLMSCRLLPCSGDPYFTQCAGLGGRGGALRGPK